jgi:hypothetical protein
MYTEYFLNKSLYFISHLNHTDFIFGSMLWRAAESRNSGLVSEEIFPRQRNETIATVHY